MITSLEIIEKYVVFFEKNNHRRIQNSPLVPENDPTTLFTSSGMQPLVPYLLGESHPMGKRLVNVQNCFRAQDIDEIGDNRHTTFFRMLGNWSLGDYFKKEQLTWFFTFLIDKTIGLGINPKRLYVTVFAGNNTVPKDEESITIWRELFSKVGIDAQEGERIFAYGVEKNWWSRAGIPENMPKGEPGGPDSEVFYDFGEELRLHEKSQWKNEPCHVNCDCGRFLEIGNSVFMQYQKQEDGSFKELPQKNVDFGGGLERLLAAVENQQDIFQTSLFQPIIHSIEEATQKKYDEHTKEMRIIADHFVAAVFITANKIVPSNKEQGYILRRLIRRALDNLHSPKGNQSTQILDGIIKQYQKTDPWILEEYTFIKNTLLTETQKYERTKEEAKRFIQKKYPSASLRTGGEIMGTSVISADDAFLLYTTHGLSPTQIKSLGYNFNDQEFTRKMEEHQKLSRKGAAQKFAGGLADHKEKTIMGHTATHLLHQALRDVLGNHVFQTGSNITTERVRFDFNFERKLTDEEIQKVEKIINEKIADNLPVHYEMIPLEKAKKLGAIGLFDEKYQKTVKVYFIGGGTAEERKGTYSVEFCGGPHVEFTGKLKRFKIVKQENIGHDQRRIYAVVGD